MALIKLNATRGLENALPAISGANLTGVSAGKILQVVQTVKTDQFSSNSTSFVDITGLTVAITPASSSNKVFIFLSTYLGASHSDRGIPLNLYRGSTLLTQGDANGSMTRASGGIHTVHGTSQQNATYNSTMMFLDSPSTTSATTYKIQGAITTGGSSGTFYVNTAGDGYTGSERISQLTTFTAMEVEA